jgi:hypothetical protein
MLLDQYFWLIGLVFSPINAAMLQYRFHKDIEQHPERAPGYRKLLIGFLALNTLVWLVMGAGIVLGGVETVFEYLEPRTANPFVIVWHALLICLWALGAVWVLFGGGARFLADHPAVFRHGQPKPWMLKLGSVVVIVGGVLAEIITWSPSWLRP